MDSLSQQLLLVLLRHLLTAVGAILITRGWGDKATYEEIAGIVVALISMYFSLQHRHQVHEQVADLKESNSVLRQTISETTTAAPCESSSPKADT